MTSILFFRCCFHAIDERYSPTTFGSSSIKNSLRWCFLFVTLFNLQGTRRYLRNVAILSDFPAFVKHFFFFFRSFGSRPPPCRTAWLEYHALPTKATPFSHLFRKPDMTVLIHTDSIISPYIPTPFPTVFSHPPLTSLIHLPFSMRTGTGSGA